MLQNNKKRNQGFTIIEVLIVLAIAGLIMLIVFLAVPALRRNSENTAARNDASKVSAAVSEFVSNNNGKLPTTATAEVAAIKESANTDQTIAIVDKVAGVGDTDEDTIQIVKGAKCNGSATPTATDAPGPKKAANAALVTDSTSRDYSVIFTIATSGNKYTSQCLGN